MIYLDNAATSRPAEEALAVFEKTARENFGNPHSVHAAGYRADAALEKARKGILSSLGLGNDYRVVFTSGSTEAINLAIRGYCLANRRRGNHLITTNVEHPAVLECVKSLEKDYGYRVTYLPVDHSGKINIEDLKKAFDDETVLVAVMALNNELGSINPVKEISRIVRSHPKAVFLSDVTQAVGKLDLDYRDIDLFGISGHKINGLKGSGCLVYRKAINLRPVIYGGGQEGGLRSGTVSVALAASLAAAIRKSISENKVKYPEIRKLNDFLRGELRKRDDVVINSDEDCSPYFLNFSLKSKRASVIVEGLSNRGIYVSSTSACQAKLSKVSYVLEAIGRDERLAGNAIRVSFGKDSTMEDVKEFLKAFSQLMEETR